MPVLANSSNCFFFAVYPISVFFSDISWIFSCNPRALQEEYERLKTLREQENPSENESAAGQQSRDAELLAEAKLLRQHKGRLEARMQVLEDHNRQLEAQLQRLRQLLDQVWLCMLKRTVQ